VTTNIRFINMKQDHPTIWSVWIFSQVA